MNGLVVEPGRVTVTRHQLGGTQSGATFRIVQLTDLHLHDISGHERRIADVVNQAAPSCVVITGDSIDDRTKVPILRDFLALLDPAPVKFATLGNWEHWSRVDIAELESAYRSAGCRLLINESAELDRSGNRIIITGVDDWTGGRPDLAAALRGIAPGPHHVVLAHSPVFRDVLLESRRRSPDVDVTQYRVEAVLSGHTHGGQIALFGWAPMRPEGSGRYVSGWYRDEGKTPLYVSRGLGTSIAPIRFGSPPEIAIFDLQLGAA